MADTWHIDFSAAHLSSGTVLSTPVGPNGEKPVGVIPYIDDITNPSLVRTKHITKTVYEDYMRAGVRVDAMYMEVGLDDVLGGYTRGQLYASRAKKGADYLGYRGAILMCCDRQFVAKNRTTITPQLWRDYLAGAISVLGPGRTGGYGFFDAADAAQGLVRFFVQCGSRSVVRPWVNGWQDNTKQPMVGGISTDRVLILKPFAGVAMSAAEDVLYPNIIPNRVYPGVNDSASTLLGWTNKEAHDANIKSSAAVNALNALGAQLAQVFTAIDAKLTLILDQVDNPTVQAQAQRLVVDAEPLRQLCASAEDIVADDESVKAAKVAAQAEKATAAAAPESTEAPE